jgi:hypothetical protein
VVDIGKPAQAHIEVPIPTKIPTWIPVPPPNKPKCLYVGPIVVGAKTSHKATDDITDEYSETLVFAGKIFFMVFPTNIEDIKVLKELGPGVRKRPTPPVPLSDENEISVVHQITHFFQSQKWKMKGVLRTHSFKLDRLCEGDTEIVPGIVDEEDKFTVTENSSAKPRYDGKYDGKSFDDYNAEQQANIVGFLYALKYINPKQLFKARMEHLMDSILPLSHLPMYNTLDKRKKEAASMYIANYGKRDPSAEELKYQEFKNRIFANEQFINVSDFAGWPFDDLIRLFEDVLKSSTKPTVKLEKVK